MLGLQIYATVFSSFDLGSGRQNSGPQACSVRTLPAEPISLTLWPVLTVNLRVRRATQETHLWVYLLQCFQKGCSEVGGPAPDVDGPVSPLGFKTELRTK